MHEYLSAAGIVQRNGKYLVAKRNPGGDLGGKWEFPGGKAEPGEDAPLALVREFREELGADIEVGEFLGSTSFSHRGKRFRLEAYSVRLLTEISFLPEHEKVRWLRFEELSLLEFADSDRKLFPLITQAG